MGNVSKLQNPHQRRRLAVIGSPIRHSRSPILHQTAYRIVGLPWEYDAIDVLPGELGTFLHQLDASWRGLSLTMPHKKAIRPFLTTIDPVARVTGSTNTVLMSDGEMHGFNTDVEGIRRALTDQGCVSPQVVHILGSGATAASAIAAAASMGAETAIVRARNSDSAAIFSDMGVQLGLQVTIASLSTPIENVVPVQTTKWPDIVISTLPGGTVFEHGYEDQQIRQSMLLDVAYDPWPSNLAKHWMAAGGAVLSGLPMLVYQALIQMRIFVNSDPHIPLVGEAEIRAALFRAVNE
jgi:shikimate dehydrogenase